MKKILSFIVIALFLFSSSLAEDEITFRNIPWGTSVKDTLAELKNQTKGDGANPSPGSLPIVLCELVVVVLDLVSIQLDVLKGRVQFVVPQNR